MRENNEFPQDNLGFPSEIFSKKSCSPQGGRGLPFNSQVNKIFRTGMIDDIQHPCKH